MKDILENIKLPEERQEEYVHPDKWDVFPPLHDRKRLNRYKANKMLFNGRHDDVYKRVQDAMEHGKDADYLTYIVANFASVISFTCADLLLGTPFDVIAGKEGGETDKAVKQMLIDNDFYRKVYEGELSRSYRGDSVLKVRYGKPKWWSSPQTIIEYVPASIYFPHLNADNIQEESGATLAWIKRSGDQLYLRKEIHVPGEIRNELYHLKGDKIGDRISKPGSIFDEYKDWQDVEKTGYSGILVEHVPNWRLDDEYFGSSDYINLHSIFDEINNRISQISAILDKHADPILIGPNELMMDKNGREKRNISRRDMSFTGISDPEDANMFKYLTWDAHLEAAFKQIDSLVDMMMLVAEISPSIFGMDKYGIAESGRALRFRLLRTLQKINRKKLYLDTGIRNILYAAQVIDNRFGSKRYNVEDVSITWHVNLPKDDKEDAETMQIRTGNKSTISQKAAIQRMDGVTAEQAEEMCAEIRTDDDFEDGVFAK